MIITNQTSLEVALEAVCDTPVHSRLLAYASQLADPELGPLTTIVVVDWHTTEEDIADVLGHSPLLNPMDGECYKSPSFEPYWDWLTFQGGVWDMVVCVGNSGRATILLIPDERNQICGIRAMCRKFAR